MGPEAVVQPAAAPHAVAVLVKVGEPGAVPPAAAAPPAPGRPPGPPELARPAGPPEAPAGVPAASTSAPQHKLGAARPAAAGRKSYTQVEDLPAGQKTLAGLREFLRPYLEDGEFKGPDGTKRRQGLECQLWLKHTQAQPAMARRLTVDGALRERPPAQAADGGAGDWMWPLLTRDQVKWLGRQDKTRERKPAQKRTKQAAAAPSKVDPDAKRRAHVLLEDADKQKVIERVFWERLRRSPTLASDAEALNAAIRQAAKDVLQHVAPDRQTWRAKKVIAGELQLTESFMQQVRIAVRAMPEQIFAILREHMHHEAPSAVEASSPAPQPAWAGVAG